MKIKKQTLLLLASLVWMIAGFNVLRIGIETYAEYQTVINYIVTIIVFLLFWFMVFYKLTNKHTIRIQGYEEEKQLFYKFFDLKSFLIMAFMISFGIIIRSFHLLPERFIAVFYTGLGAALFSFFNMNIVHVNILYNICQVFSPVFQFFSLLSFYNFKRTDSQKRIGSFISPHNIIL